MPADMSFNKNSHKHINTANYIRVLHAIIYIYILCFIFIHFCWIRNGNKFKINNPGHQSQCTDFEFASKDSSVFSGLSILLFLATETDINLHIFGFISYHFSHLSTWMWNSNLNSIPSFMRVFICNDMLQIRIK